MRRIDTAGTASMPPTPTALAAEGYFKDRAGELAGTLVDADWMNMLQESLIGVLDDQAIAHSKTDSTRLLIAINALVDERIALKNPALRGFIQGFHQVVTIGGSAFTIDDGLARDFANAKYMRNSAGSKSKDCNVAWNTGTGAMASSNTWADPYFGRVFAIGKAANLDINFGVDQSATAANLLSDAAASGFTTYRQIGWVIRVGAGLLDYRQERAWPQFWRLHVPLVDIDESTSTSTTHFDVSVPAGTLHVGAHSYDTSTGSTTVMHGIVGRGETPPLPTAALWNVRDQTGSADNSNVANATLNSITTTGTATLQGRITQRWTRAGTQYRCSTLGFLWDQRAV
jgi:hypothetical protein